MSFLSFMFITSILVSNVFSKLFINWNETTDKELMDNGHVIDMDPADDYFQHCGDFLELPVHQKRAFLYSPGFPKPYLRNSFCIWLIMVENEMRRDCYLKAKVKGFKGQEGECYDYLEIRDGAKSADLLTKLCARNDTPTEVNSSSYYMWIKFKSDNLDDGSQPWKIEFTTNDECTGNKEDDAESTAKTLAIEPSCKSYQFECRNKECLSMSYRCDGFNDCGCINGCDEAECQGLRLGISVRMSISVTMGVLLFVIICVIGATIEMKDSWLTLMSEQQRERDQRDLRRRRASRAVNDFTKNTNISISEVPST